MKKETETMGSAQNGQNGQGNEKKKMSKKAKIAWASGGGVGVAAIATALYFGAGGNVIGFGGVSNINDSINVEVSELSVPELMANMIPGTLPVEAGQEATDLESFQKQIDAIEKELDKKTDAVLGQNQMSEPKESKVFEIPPIAVLFDYKSSEVSETGAKLLNEYASVYNKTNKQAKISVSGYTCDLGTDKLNDKLSQMRAESVKNILVSSGVSAENIDISWYGKSKYKEFSYPNKSDYRRVVVTIQ